MCTLELKARCFDMICMKSMPKLTPVHLLFIEEVIDKLEEEFASGNKKIEIDILYSDWLDFGRRS